MAYIDKPIRIEFYDTRYNFREPVREHLNVYDLSRIHELVEDHTLVTRETDQSNPFQKKFYSIGNDFYRVYHDFIKWFVEPLVGESVVFQKVPTFRIQMPDNKGVGAKHKDSDYSHSTDEINFVVPLTEMKDTTAIHTADGAIDIRADEVLIFDGANIEHWNEINKEGYSRVSFDFRVIPKSKYEPSKKKSINTKLPMEIGGYWETLGRGERYEAFSEQDSIRL